VATGGADGVVCLYDTAQRKALSKMKGHDGAVHRVRLHPRAAVAVSRSGRRRQASQLALERSRTPL